MVKIGSLEYNVFEFQIEVKRIKRKKELIQIQINHEKNIHINEIEKKLADEYKIYEKSLEELLANINTSYKRINSQKLSLKDTLKLKKIYKEIVKKYHPDLIVI